MLKIFYTDTFPIPLPEKHRFPKDKYRLLRNQISTRLAGRVDMQIPKPAADEAILRAHSAAYLHRFVHGGLTSDEIRRVGLPWSRQIVKRTRYSVGATIAACRAAIAEGYAVNLGGGTHHAFRDRGQGFCWLNDSAIAARAVQAENLTETILIVDCDVHQGNGTAAILKNDPSVFTFSIHGKNNFPYHKETSDMDIALEDGTGDDGYLKALEKGLDIAIQRFQAGLVIYLAGADPYKKDRFGRLALTKDGLARRDRLVLARIIKAGLPVTVTMAGGYAPEIRDTVDIHFRTIETLLELSEYSRFAAAVAP